MLLRFALAVAVTASVASGEHTEHVKCSHRCSFNGRSIISCAGEVSNEDILPCSADHSQATVLDLALSEIHHISRDLFRDIRTIRHLYLDFVETERVDEDSFTEMNKLESISLKGLGPERLEMFLAVLVASNTFLAVNIDGNYKNCSSKLRSMMDQLTAANILIEYSQFTPRCRDGDKVIPVRGDHDYTRRPPAWHTEKTQEYVTDRADSDRAASSVNNPTITVSVIEADNMNKIAFIQFSGWLLLTCLLLGCFIVTIVCKKKSGDVKEVGKKSADVHIGNSDEQSPLIKQIPERPIGPSELQVIPEESEPELERPTQEIIADNCRADKSFTTAYIRETGVESSSQHSSNKTPSFGYNMQPVYNTSMQHNIDYPPDLRN